jgi:hypothetical protein
MLDSSPDILNSHSNPSSKDTLAVSRPFILRITTIFPGGCPKHCPTIQKPTDPLTRRSIGLRLDIRLITRRFTDQSRSGT